MEKKNAFICNLRVRRERVGSSAGRSPKVKLEEEEVLRPRGAGAKRGPKPHSTNAAGRATLTWKKGKGKSQISAFNL